MENDTTISKEGLFEPVLPGSVTFENSILAPLHNSYLYEDSKESFTYSSAQLINNSALQKRYSAFRAEKLKQGYTEEELEESFGFLLLADKSRANRLADTGLIAGQGTCTTLGDCSKGVYISKYSDCLDLKRWYDGKTGYLVLLKLTKGRVKEVAENYTQNFTPPTAGFDCHVSEQIGTVCATTSLFLAFERTQYYMYELVDGVEKVEPCPRHVCPFAIVAFSYGKTSLPLELKEKSQEKSSFYYQPWCGQLEIRSVLYNIGLKSNNGAMFPAKLPKIIKVDHAIGVSELRKTLSQAVFETSPVGEVSLDGKWFSMYDVISFEARNDLASLTQELKEKDLALVICLEDGGFLLLLHPSNFLSYEGADADKSIALRGMFIYPDSRSVPRETKTEYHLTKVSLEVLQVLPALNYAELEMEKCPPKQNEEPLPILKRHLQNFAALIFPGLTSSPSREASMFPDQYDVPNGFPLVSPKWTEQTGNRLQTYLKSPCNFQFPVSNALELLTAGKQQRNDDNDEDVYYYISSPEAPQYPNHMVLERDLLNDTDRSAFRDVSEDEKTAIEQQAGVDQTVTAKHCALVEEVNKPAAALVATPDNNPVEKTDTSPTSGDLPTEHYTQNTHAVTAQDCAAEAAECSSADDKCSGDEIPRAVTETIQTTSMLLSHSDTKDDAPTAACNADVEAEQSDKVNCISILHIAEKLQEAELPTSISPPTTSVTRTEALIEGCKDVQPKASSNVSAKTTYLSNRRGKRRRTALKRRANADGQITTPCYNTTLSSCPSTEATPEQSSSSSEAIRLSPSKLKKDWRSLPRRKRNWNADLSIKRTLRSDIKSSEMPRVSDAMKKNNTTAEPTVTRKVPSTPKRKMEGINMRERYGLKTIVTDCGFVFVPHGSEVAPVDIKSHGIQQAQQPSSVTTNSSIGEKPITSPTHKSQLSEMESTDQHMAQTHISTNTTEVLLSGGITEKNSEQSSVFESTKRNKAEAKDVYKAISISKLKTVLKRASKSLGAKDHGKSISDTVEPKPKRCKPEIIELYDSGNKGNTESNEPETNRPSYPVQRTTSSQGKQSSKIPTENGCNNSEILSATETVQQSDQKLTPKPVQKSIEEKCISSDGQCNKANVDVGAPAPSDALNLLADLALSVNSEKMLPNLEAKHLGAMTTSSPQTVIQLLKNLNPRLKLPAKSPFPEGLVVTGDLILDISKEHSYSQPTSPLAGACNQVQRFDGGLVTNLLLKLPDLTNHLDFHNKGGKNGWKFLPSLAGPSAVVKSKRSLFLSCRSIVEKGDSIQVTRHWTENYDFKFDSKFTNDRLDKCVTRALHGKWDFSIEDTYEQVHLIFHMWIGLFYSKATSRLFHFDQICPSAERKDSEKAFECAVLTSPALSDIESTSKEDKPTSIDPVSDALDLSVKIPGTDDYCITANNSSPSSVTCAKVKHVEDKMAANRPSLDVSPSVPAECIPMDYRSTLEALDENSTTDHNDCTDTDDDATKLNESSYTNVLGSNRAYGQLCDFASNVKIDEQKSLNVQKNKLVSEDLSTPMSTNIHNAGMKSVETKDVTVFHQVVGSVRPNRSEVHNLLPRKKIILKSLHLLDKHKDEVPVTVHSQPASSDEKCEAQVNEENRESTSVCVGGHSVISAPASDARIEFIQDEKSESVQKTDGEMSNETSDTPANELNMSSQAKEEVKSVVDGTARDVNNCNVELHVNDVATEKVESKVEPQIPIDRPHVSNETEEEVKPLSNVLSENPGEVLVSDGKKDAETSAPVADNTADTVDQLVKPVRDNTRSHDARHDAGEDVSVKGSHGECYNENISDKVNPQVNIREIAVDVKDKLCVIDENPVDEQNINNKNKEATPELVVKTNVSADAQDVNDKDDTLQDVKERTKDRIASKPDVRGFSSVDGQHDVDMTEETYVMEELESGKDESNKDVTDEREGRLEAATISDADIEFYSGKKNTVDEFQDWTGCEDVNISDQELQDGNRKKVSGDETLGEDTGKLQRGVIKPEAQGSEPRISEYSSTGQASSTSHRVTLMEDSHSLSTDDGFCPTVRNKSESTMLQDPPLLQHEIPEVNSYKPTNMCAGVCSLTEIDNPEPYDIRSSSVPGASGESAELKILETSTDQNPAVSTISECSPAKVDESFSLDLQIDSEADELSDIQDEKLQDVTESERCYVKRSSTNACLALDSSEDSNSESAHKDQIYHNQYNATIKVTDESPTFRTEDYVQEKDDVYSGNDTISPYKSTNEVDLQQDKFGGCSEQCGDVFYEELPPTWTHSARFKPEEHEWYPPDEVTRYTNGTFPREFAYSPRETTQSSTNSPDWVPRIHCSKSSPYVNESNERVLYLRHQAEFSEESGSHRVEPVHYSKRKHKKRFCQSEWGDGDFNATVDFNIQKTFSCSLDRSSSSRVQTSSPYQRKGESKQSFDWRRYFRREGMFESNGNDDGPFRDPPSSIVTMFDKKGNRVIFERPPTQHQSSGIHGMGQNVEEQQFKSVTQSLMELEYLIFLEKMTNLLQNSKTTSRANPQHRVNVSPVENPLTIQFSRLDEQNSILALDKPWPLLSKFKINVDMSERKTLKKTSKYGNPLHLQHLFNEGGSRATNSKLSDISKECSKFYHTVMNDVCFGKASHKQKEDLRRKWDIKCVTTSEQSGLHHLHDNLNSFGRQACETKYKFYILVTSADPFFEETKDLLEAEGHTAVEPHQFESNASGQTPLLIIVRNEDVAKHIFEVPHLLALKKSSQVLFLGIDQPDDVVNLTHQELFAKGGFVVFDGTALDTLSLENIKKFVGIMEELDKKGKWKWFLHYRDSRKLREDARCSPEAQRVKQFIDCCQEAGIVEVLPYHECDVVSRDRPEYLRCLVHLQIQNISARFPVFITDTPDNTFEKNGISTMNIYTFSRILSNDTCSVS